MYKECHCKQPHALHQISQSFSVRLCDLLRHITALCWTWKGDWNMDIVQICKNKWNLGSSCKNICMCYTMISSRWDAVLLQITDLGTRLQNHVTPGSKVYSSGGKEQAFHNINSLPLQHKERFQHLMFKLRFHVYMCVSVCISILIKTGLNHIRWFHSSIFVYVIHFVHHTHRKIVLLQLYW